MIDIRKAMRLLDVMYVTANESIRHSVDKIVTLARLDDPAPFGAEAGPFESMLNDFEPIKWQFSSVKTSAEKFERFITAPHNEYQFTNWLSSYINSLPLISNLNDKISYLENKLNQVTAELATLKEKDESKPNSNTE